MLTSLLFIGMQQTHGKWTLLLNNLMCSSAGYLAVWHMIRCWRCGFLSFRDMSIWWCKTCREFGKYNYCWMVHTVVCVLFFNKEKNVLCLCHCVKLNFLAFNCKLQSLNFNKYIDSGFKTHVTYILHKWSLGVFFKRYLIGMLSNQFIQRYVWNHLSGFEKRILSWIIIFFFLCRGGKGGAIV